MPFTIQGSNLTLFLPHPDWLSLPSAQTTSLAPISISSRTRNSNWWVSQHHADGLLLMYSHRPSPHRTCALSSRRCGRHAIRKLGTSKICELCILDVKTYTLVPASDICFCSSMQHSDYENQCLCSPDVAYAVVRCASSQWSNITDKTERSAYFETFVYYTCASSPARMLSQQQQSRRCLATG